MFRRLTSTLGVCTSEDEGQTSRSTAAKQQHLSICS
jgi:hypothetical protein